MKRPFVLIIDPMEVHQKQNSRRARIVDFMVFKYIEKLETRIKVLESLEYVYPVECMQKRIATLEKKLSAIANMAKEIAE